jgi:hypothetical protein
MTLKLYTEARIKFNDSFAKTKRLWVQASLAGGVVAGEARWQMDVLLVGFPKVACIKFPEEVLEEDKIWDASKEKNP